MVGRAPGTLWAPSRSDFTSKSRLIAAKTSKPIMAQNIQAQATPNLGTFSALRSSNFRLYFAGQLVSISGTWMQNLAQGFLVFSLTQSNVWLGLVACAAGLPVILLSPVAGVIVERVPRRRILAFTQTVQMVLAFVLAGLAFTNLVQVWHI